MKPQIGSEVSDVGRSDSGSSLPDTASQESMYVIPGSELVAPRNNRSADRWGVGHVRLSDTLGDHLDDSDRRLAEAIADGQQHRPRWQRDADCRGVGVVTFFPTRGKPSELASALCSACSVIAKFLDWALAQRDDHGIAAGMSGRQRRRFRANRKRGAA